MPSLENLRWYRDQLLQRAQMLRGPLAILMYHRVCPPGDHAFLQDAGVPWISPEVFRAQLRFLKERGFAVLSLGEILERLERRERFAPRSVAITFDDGFRDNLVHAARILAAEGLPASFFIATDMLARAELLFEHKLFLALARLGPVRTRALVAAELPTGAQAQDAWLHHLNYRLEHDRRLALDRVLGAALDGDGADQRAIARELYLGPGELREMLALGHAIGSHGAGHHHHGTLKRAQREADLDRAQACLRELIGEELLPVYSSAYGGHAARDLPLLRARGYRAAASARFGTNGRRTNPYFLRRIALGENSQHRLRFLDSSARWAGRIDAIC